MRWPLPSLCSGPLLSRAAALQIDNKIIGTEGSLLYSGLDLVPESGDLIVRRHDGKEIVEPGFEFENCALQTAVGCWVLGDVWSLDSHCVVTV